jgi:hypothetical protein
MTHEMAVGALESLVAWHGWASLPEARSWRERYV